MEFFHDVNDKLFAFESLYLDIINEHTPLKQFLVRGNQVPFMNEQWRIAIRHRNKLCGKSSLMIALMLITPFTKKKRNKCTSLGRKAVKAYFLDKSEKANSNDF